MTDNPFMSLGEPNPFAQMDAKELVLEGVKPTTSKFRYYSHGTPLSHDWDYVQRGDQITVEWFDLTTGSPVSETGSVVEIDDVRFYIKTSGNGFINAPQSSVRMISHLIYENGIAYGTIEAPEHRRRSVYGEIGTHAEHLAALRTPNPFMDL